MVNGTPKRPESATRKQKLFTSSTYRIAIKTGNMRFVTLSFVDQIIYWTPTKKKNDTAKPLSRYNIAKAWLCLLGKSSRDRYLNKWWQLEPTAAQGNKLPWGRVNYLNSWRSAIKWKVLTYNQIPFISPLQNGHWTLHDTAKHKYLPF